MGVLVLFAVALALASAADPAPSRPKTEDLDNSPGQPLTAEDFANADQLGTLNAALPPRPPPLPPPESEELFEGDISGVAGFSADRLLAAARGSTGAEADVRNAVRSQKLLWPGGAIPYVISVAFDAYERSAIAAAILEFHRRSCIRFVPRSTQREYVYLLKGEGCHSVVGRSGAGAQALSLGFGCAQRGVALHELLHAVGFWHEHSRADRDDHVTVLWSNVRRGMEHNFQRLSWQFVNDLGAPYDTGSIMHYAPYSFSKDGASPTILPKRKGTSIGQRQGFSEIDLWKLNRLYGCRRVGGGGWGGGQGGGGGAWNGFRCTDRHINCVEWARSGHCYANADYMSAMCASSCGACL